jgi:hypothetical protein
MLFDKSIRRGGGHVPLVAIFKILCHSLNSIVNVSETVMAFLRLQNISVLTYNISTDIRSKFRM